MFGMLSDGWIAKSGSNPPGSNCETAGLLVVGRLAPLSIGIGILLDEVLGVCRTVTIAAGLLLSAGFSAGVRNFDFH